MMISAASVADFFRCDSRTSVQNCDTRKKTLHFDTEAMTPKPDIHY